MPDLSFLQEQANDSAKRNYQKGYSDGYNKAIDDFVKALQNHSHAQYHLDQYLLEDIDEVAEQLKG